MNYMKLGGEHARVEWSKLLLIISIVTGLLGRAQAQQAAISDARQISDAADPSVIAKEFNSGLITAEAAHEAGLRWFRDAKFGIFVHWGLYSVPEGEWNGNKGYGEWFQIETRMPGTQYAKFADEFNPDKFDAKEWVKHVKDAGIKYIVITTKHHDGFAMYDTKLSDYSVVKATPWHRDPMKELAAACREAGVQLCFYYSIPDWHSTNFPAALSQRHFHGNPNPNADLEKYVKYMKGQIREILTQYGPIGYLWFDDGGAFEGVDRAQRAKLIHAQEIVDEVHQLQPWCVIDDRLGLPGDCDTPEQNIPAGQPTRMFEVCMSLNHHWGYNKNDHDWKSPKEVVRNLVDTASKGGNYLLGVGAMADGIFPPPEAETILDTVGQWANANSESIHGVTASPFDRLMFDGRCTQKPGVLYLHVFTWPEDGQLLVPVMNKVKRAYLLADPERKALSETTSEHGVTIALPAQAPDLIDTVVALEIDGQPEMTALSQNLAVDKPVEVSSVWPGREDELNKTHITDGHLETLWAAEESARSAWVKVDLQKEFKVSEAMLSDAPYGRTRAFDLEAQIDGEWKKIAEGTTIGDKLYLSFPPVKAQLFRLNIRKASDTPTLAEFQLFAQ
jgi:alpha-L-fucosidase